MRYRKGSVVLCCLLVLLPVRAALCAADDYVSPESIPGAVVIDAEQLIELVGRREDLVIIDSRIMEDRNAGYIEGSRHLLDRDTSCDSLAKLLPGAMIPVVFYCNGINCERSDKAVVIALDCGYSEVYWFRGGIEAWRDENYPLVE